MFDDLLNHTNEAVRTTAEKVQELIAMRDAGEITEEECKELCKDVLTLENIEQSLDDLELRQTVVQAYQQLSQLAGIVSKVI